MKDADQQLLKHHAKMWIPYDLTQVVLSILSQTYNAAREEKLILFFFFKQVFLKNYITCTSFNLESMVNNVMALFHL